MLIKKIIIIFSFLNLVGCAQTPSLIPSNLVEIAPGVAFELPMWKLPNRPIEAMQLLKAGYGKKTFSLQVRLSLTNKKLSLLGLDSLGRRAFTLDWSEASILSERADWLPDTIKSENILSDIIMAFWPERTLEMGLRGKALAWAFNANQRILLQDDVPVMTISTPVSWDARVEIVNHARGYEIEVLSTELKE